MAIYRGPGGAGDATADTTNNSEIATTKAAEAAASATAAASSAGEAADSAANAATSETNAQDYANAAATSAGEAAASVIEAQAVVDSIGTAVDDAQTAATDAAASAVTAESAANDAVDSAALAQDWATYTAGAVAGGEYSAKYNANLASGYATDASDSADAAATSASNASSSASAAATSASNAAASYDAFDDRYLGAKSTAPSVDNDGNALLTGALYWNTTGGQLYVWDGSAWQAAAFSATGAVVAVNGTSPISSSGGTSPTISIAQATTSTSGYLSSTDWNTFNGKGTGTVTSVGLSVPTGLSVANTPVTGTGTIAVTYTSGYAIPTTSSQTNWDTAYTDRLKWDGGSTGLNAATGRTSLGLGTMAVETASNYLTTATAASTYQTQAGMSSYLTTSTAASTYQPLDSDLTAFAAKTAPSGAVVGTTDTQTLSAKTLTNPTVTNYTETAYTANTSTALTVDLTNGTVQVLTLTGNATITMPTAGAGKSFIILLRQDATGSRSVTWSTVNWAGGTAPTITSTASKQDIFSFFSDGTSWYGVTVGQNYTQ